MKFTKEDIIAAIPVDDIDFFEGDCRDVTYNKDGTVDYPKFIMVKKLSEVVASIENDTQDCFTGLTKDDDWQEGAVFVLKLLRERIGEVLESCHMSCEKCCATKCEDKNICQACMKAESQCTLELKGEKPYKLCMNCHLLLTIQTLDKVGYKNLLKNGHNPNEYMIHEDFYDKDGTYLQEIG